MWYILSAKIERRSMAQAGLSVFTVALAFAWVPLNCSKK